MKYENTGAIFNRQNMRNRIEALETANDHLHLENQDYENALKSIAYSEEDSSCNELALKYEVIAEKALND